MLLVELYWPIPEELPMRRYQLREMTRPSTMTGLMVHGVSHWSATRVDA